MGRAPCVCVGTRPGSTISALGCLGHLAAFLGTATAGRGAVFAGLFAEFVALGRAGIADLCAEGAPLHHKLRTARHHPGATSADLGALKAEPQAICFFRTADAAVDASFAGSHTLKTGLNAGLKVLLSHIALLGCIKLCLHGASIDPRRSPQAIPSAKPFDRSDRWPTPSLSLTLVLWYRVNTRCRQNQGNVLPVFPASRMLQRECHSSGSPNPPVPEL